MAGIAAILEPFVPIMTALGAVTSIAGSIYQMVSPQIKIPEIKIPEADLRRINQAIKENKALSDQAKSIIQQNLQMYQKGQLNPGYQAKLEEWWKKNSTALQQKLAAMGLSDSTMAASAFAELQMKYTDVYGDLLNRQLQESLALTGLSQEYLNDLFNKAKLELEANLARYKSWLEAQQLSWLQAQQRGEAFGRMQSGFQDFGKWIETYGKQTPTTTQTSFQAPMWSYGSGLMYGPEPYTLEEEYSWR